MKAIEALEAMKQGLKVCIYWPDCEMWQLVEKDRIEMTLVDFSNGKPSEVCSPNQFLKSFEGMEFVLYQSKPQGGGLTYKKSLINWERLL